MPRAGLAACRVVGYDESTDRRSVRAERFLRRVVKSAQVRQDEILDVAQELFVRRGFGGTSVQALIDEVGIAKGTFYHHFPSKAAVLEALLERLIGEIPALVRPVLDDAERGALASFRAFFSTLDAWKAERAPLMVAIDRALHDGSRVDLVEGLRQATRAMAVPLVVEVVEQGIREGVFRTRSPEHAGRVVWSILEALGEAMAAALHGPTSLAELRGIHRAYTESVERVLGAPEGSLVLVDEQRLQVWLAAFSRGSDPAEVEEAVQPPRRTP
jgi:AcrR family transcriptional regulator